MEIDVSVFKEELKELGRLASHQYRLYEDACDLGVWVEDFDHYFVRDVQRFLKSIPESMKERTEVRENLNCVDVTWKITFEWELGNVQVINIYFYKRGKKQFIQIK